jgi:feruloyl esterase
MRCIGYLSISAIFLFCLNLLGCNGTPNIDSDKCSACKNLSFRDMTFGKSIAITDAEYVPSGVNVLKPYCRVKARIWPEIDFEIELPVRSSWNGKLLYNGGGGWDGFIPDLSIGRKRDYASAGSNGGHNSSLSWLTDIPYVGGLLGQVACFDGSAFDMSDPDNANVPQKLDDFAHRAAYEGSVLAKRVIAAYYDTGPKKSYWMGCSNGGRGAMMMAQRHPEVFDGYIAGAPHFTYTGTTMRGLWDSQASAGCLDGACDDSKAFIPLSVYNSDAVTYLAYVMPKLSLLKEKVYDKCDCGGAYDSVAGDGIIDQPDKCGFDPTADLLPDACPGDVDAPDCFTSGQREALKKIYDGMEAQGMAFPGMDAGRFPGTPVGAEGIVMLGWMGSIVPMPPDTLDVPEGIGDMLCAPFFQFLQYNLAWQEGADWDWKAFNFDSDPQKITRYGIAKVLDAVSGDLSAVKAKGAKIIHYHGWADALVTPLYSKAYYDKVLVPKMGNVDSFYRLFFVPGFSHCQGGVGCGDIDWLTALENWVEKGMAPDAIIGTRAVDYTMGWYTRRTRPMCPYPKVARYKGSGSTDDAANFVCE